MYFALSRVDRPEVDTDDPGLWLYEEPCPAVTPTGIALHGQQFWHPDLQGLVGVLPTAARRRLVVRYDRALLARGTLREIIVGQRNAQDRFVELARCPTRDVALATVDHNLVLRKRRAEIRMLRAKVSLAQQSIISLEHGTAALTRFRDEQAARLRRQRAHHPAPIAAAPITWQPTNAEMLDSTTQRQVEAASYLTAPEEATDTSEASREREPAQGSSAPQDLDATDSEGATERARREPSRGRGTPPAGRSPGPRRSGSPKRSREAPESAAGDDVRATGAGRRTRSRRGAAKDRAKRSDDLGASARPGMVADAIDGADPLNGADSLGALPAPAARGNEEEDYSLARLAAELGGRTGRFTDDDD